MNKQSDEYNIMNFISRHYVHFGWNSITSPVNVLDMYQRIAEQFCMVFYPTYDNALDTLGHFFSTHAAITYLDSEVQGFNALRNKMQQHGIYNVLHQNCHANTQPINDHTLLITVTGQLRINGVHILHQFTETIILQRDHQNRFIITNLTFVLH